MRFYIAGQVSLLPPYGYHSHLLYQGSSCKSKYCLQYCRFLLHEFAVKVRENNETNKVIASTVSKLYIYFLIERVVSHNFIKKLHMLKKLH